MLKKTERGLKPAFAYLWERAAAQQRQAIYNFAQLSGFEIVQEFLDISSAIGVGFEAAPGFIALLKLIEIYGIRTIIVDSAERIASDAVTQEMGYLALQQHGIDVIAVDSPSSFVKDSPLSSKVRQAIESLREIDRSVDAALSRGASKRQNSSTGAPWRKTYAELEPQATTMAKRLHLNGVKSGKRVTLREISRELAAAGHLTKDGKPFHPEAIRRMLKGYWPKTSSK